MWPAGRPQHFEGQCPSKQNGVMNARYHLPSPPQALTAQVPFEQLAEHNVATAHVLDAIWRFFFAASDGAAEMAMAITATAPISINFVIDFMV
jgi:hypothetical protein